MKKCNKCGEFKEYEEFYSSKFHKDDLLSTCKACWKEKSKKYNNANKEKIEKTKKIWREKNKERIREWAIKSSKKYYLNNRENILQKQRLFKKEYRKKNKEKIRLNRLLHKESMSDFYIRKLIKNKSSLRKREEIPKEFIETYRELLKLKREIKEKTCQMSQQ